MHELHETVSRRRRPPRWRGLALGALLASAVLEGGRAATPPERPHARLVSELRERLVEAERDLTDGRFLRASASYAAIRDAAAELSPSNLALARAVDGLADAERALGRRAEAAAGYRRAATLWEELLGSEQPRLAVTLHNLGGVELERGRPDLAVPAFRRALAIWEVTLGRNSTEFDGTARALAVAVARLRRGPGPSRSVGAPDGAR